MDKISTKEQVIELIKEHSKNNIDISDNYELWYKFLKEQGILKTYKEVYAMDLAYLQCERDMNFVKNGKWDVDGLIECDQDIVYINDNLWLDHHQEYIETNIGQDRIKQFCLDNNIPIPPSEKEKKQKALNWAINQAYIDLNQSDNGFSRFDALLFIFGHNFGNQKLYFASDINKVKKELLKCFQEVLIERNKLEEKKESEDSNYASLYLDLWLPNHNTYSDEEDEHYCELIRFGGYEILEDGHQILESDAILLINDDGIYTLDYFTYENMHHLCDYIAEVFESYKNDCLDVGGEVCEQETNQKLNEIIDSCWKDGKIDFDYAEFFKQ